MPFLAEQTLYKMHICIFSVFPRAVRSGGCGRDPAGTGPALPAGRPSLQITTQEALTGANRPRSGERSRGPSAPAEDLARGALPREPPERMGDPA